MEEELAGEAVCQDVLEAGDVPSLDVDVVLSADVDEALAEGREIGRVCDELVDDRRRGGVVGADEDAAVAVSRAPPLDHRHRELELSEVGALARGSLAVGEDERHPFVSPPAAAHVAGRVAGEDCHVVGGHSSGVAAVELLVRLSDIAEPQAVGDGDVVEVEPGAGEGDELCRPKLELCLHVSAEGDVHVVAPLAPCSRRVRELGVGPSLGLVGQECVSGFVAVLEVVLAEWGDLSDPLQFAD